MNRKVNISLVAAIGIVSLAIFGSVAKNELLSFSLNNNVPASINNLPAPQKVQVMPRDTPPGSQIDLQYPIYDNFTDFFITPNENTLDLQDPSNIQHNIDYDPESNQYIISETIGDQFYSDPTYMSFEDFLQYEYQQEDREYWDQRSNAATLLERKGVIPEVNVNNRLFDRIFGGTKVDIRPQGNIDLTFGYNYQNILNPSLTKRQRTQGSPNFDMNINLNVIGKIGDKLKLTTDYNTQAAFDFQNQVKLDYTGYDDEIIKKIEAGNVQFPLSTTLIQGNSSLFGLKTQLQFGRLTVTNVISQQQSQAQNLTIQGGAQTQTFSLSADQYDENRNFWVSQYFRSNFDQWMSTLPIVSSPITITKMEVWITNKTGTTVDTRNIVAFQDLGEATPYSPNVIPTGVGPLPYANSLNNSLNVNDLYTKLTAPGSAAASAARSVDQTIGELTGPNFNLVPVQDFEKTYARKLAPTEYTFNSQLGFILLNQQLQPDDVLGVAFQYTYNGVVYQVGEFAQDVPPNVDTPNVLFLKLLKSTSTQPRLPIWDLMMKNIYSLGAYQISAEDFYLDIYYLDPGGGEKRYIPADNLNGIPLIRVLGLDRLNNNNDPQPDGIFDFIPGLTINPANGKVIFPVVEPFGKDLAAKFSTPNAALPYVYQVLYDSTKTIALQFPEFDRYSLKGTYKSSVSSEISLGGFNIPQGSVTVSAGGQVLVENQDYTVDYNLGRVKILNQSILNSGVPINVSYENNDLFSFQTKTLFGTRLDYFINDNFSLGGTFLHLSERPYTTKLNVGDDPISNSIFGMDANYHSGSEWITKMVDKIPLIDTKEASTVTLSGEVARLQPGHSKAIGQDGTVYIDDFEGTQTTYDLKFPYSSWALASTPQNSLFPEATLENQWKYGFNRAKLSWYNIDPFFWQNSAPTGISGVGAQQNGFYSRQVLEQEIFPNLQTQAGFPQNITTFDLRFEPKLRGPYNFDTLSTLKVFAQADGNNEIGFADSTTWPKRWGGIQRSIDQTDFEEANVEYIQFWVLNPWLNSAPAQHHTNARLYVDLGNVSEDVLRDSKFFYENGLSADGSTTNEDSSVWSYTPLLPPLNNAFDYNPTSRQNQDVGYDGRKTDQEADFYKNYVNYINSHYGSDVAGLVAADPSNDNYAYFDDDAYNNAQTGILDRYEKYNGPDGNSPISSGNQSVSFAATNEPESEDLNRDNTVNETEQYFEYEVNLSDQGLDNVGQNFIADIQDTDVALVNGFSPGTEKWIQIKIPIEEYKSRFGNISDFKSIRFIRMYLTGCDTTTILRFARMELVRNQWRKYLFSLQTPGEYIPNDNNTSTAFTVTSVSINENSGRQPIPYQLPPGVVRETLVGQTSSTLQNEQSLSLQICNLQDGDSRAVYKDINLDLRTYQTLQMYVHAEGVLGQPDLQNGDITAFLRLGSDFVSNYYEYEVPLAISPFTSITQDAIWPAENNFNITLSELTAAKEERNAEGIALTQPFIYYSPTTGAKITIVGNPDLGITPVCMLGVRNPKAEPGGDDSGNPVCTEVWFDELRLSGFNEQGGSAATARTEIQLADFGQVALSGTMHTIGFGQLEQKLNERYKDNLVQYDAAGTFQMGKFLPKNFGLQLPMYVGYSKTASNPQYDPYDHDILLKDKLNLLTTAAQRDSARKAAQTATSITSLNFTNIRKVSIGKNSKVHIYSPENLNVTYAYTKTFTHNPILQSDLLKNHHGEFAYLFPGKSKYITPFTSLLPAKSKYLKIVRDFNFNLLPTNLSFRTAVDRQFGETKLRPISADEIILPTYNKFFTWDRFHGFKFDVTKALSLDFNSTTNTRIDEPEGLIDTREKKDSIWNNFKNFGRTTNYTHAANAAYTLPLSKFPLLDWTNVTARYGATYTWLTAPLVIDPVTSQIALSTLGNTISNGQNITLNSDFNFRTLYNHVKFLKRYDTQGSTTTSKQVQQPVRKGEKGGDQTASDSTDQKTQSTKTTSGNTIGPEAFFIRLPLLLKKITVNYTEANNTTLPGYLFKPKFIGQDFNANAPGWDFILGYQPDSNWMNNVASKGWITGDTALNYQFIQNATKNLAIKATLEPIKDVNIDLNFTRTTTDNLTEYFKRPYSNSNFEHLSRVQFGTLTLSYISIQTAFTPLKPNTFSQSFINFENYRQVISSRLADLNPNSVGAFPNDSFPNYRDGYGPYSQDVLIPAFLAAYTNQDPKGVGLNLPTNKFPLPNWRITYNGLTKMNWAKKIWTNVNLSHGYTSTLTYGSFSSSLNFTGEDVNGQLVPTSFDPLSNNFIPYYTIPSVAINETFSPLLGIDMTWKSSLTTKLDISKSRNLSFSMYDYQLTEARTSEITTGVGYKFKHVPIPFKINGKKKHLKNDVNFQCNVSYANNITLSQRLDQNTPAQPTSGITTIAISPAADYTVNSRLNVHVFFDKRYTIPAISTSYPIRNTDAGVTIRFTLAQ